MLKKPISWLRSNYRIVVLIILTYFLATTVTLWRVNSSVDTVYFTEDIANWCGKYGGASLVWPRYEDVSVDKDEAHGYLENARNGDRCIMKKYWWQTY